MSTFEELKKKAMSTENLTSLKEKVESKAKSYKDDRFWKPTVNREGNGYAKIRFLPSRDIEECPWVLFYSHGFQGPGGAYYIENSRTSLKGEQDPCGDLNSKLWNEGGEAGKEQARKQKRKTNYVANIIVLEDPDAPENNGKVFLYNFGARIFDKVKGAMSPQFDDEAPINPFDMFDQGADFKVKIMNVAGYRNYDKSEFDKPCPLYNGDEAKQKEVFEQLYSLKEFLDPSNFKSYVELKRNLNRVLCINEDEGVTSNGGSQVESPKEILKEEPLPKEDTSSIEDKEDFFASLAASD